ncbi:hypothetical protein [Kribbella sp. NPDC049584]|uniref:hypothetical protein n=1 Tax=Kribbella sp. NPDC049584 TaxID=3154833 RepID=UPI00342F2202
MDDNRQDSDYRPQPNAAPAALPGIDVIEQQAAEAGVLDLLRSAQNDLAVVFDEVAVGPDSRLTFYLKPTPTTHVPLIRVQLDPDALALDLDPIVVLRKLKIPDEPLDEFLAALPQNQVDLGSRRLRAYVTTPTEIQRTATFLMRRF